MAIYVFGWFLISMGVFLFWAHLIISIKEKRQEQIRPIKKFKTLKEERKEWQDKIDESEYLLTGYSWRDKEGKREFIEIVYGKDIPDTLWYAIGKFTTPLTEEELKEICRIFWYGKMPLAFSYDFVDTHDPEIGTALCIRNARDFTTEITINGEDCPLYQIGNPILGRLEQGCVSFPRIYEKRLK